MPTSLQPVLAKHPFLENLTPDSLSLLTGCAKNARFAAGAYLTRAGNSADKFYLLRTGRVTVSVPSPTRPVVVHTATPGELIGWSWIVKPYRYRFDAQAAEETLAFEIDGKCLRAKCDQSPELGYQLLQRVTVALSERVADLQFRLVDCYGSPQP